ncbi:MAG: LytTR family DNA-binding domain-containing protein [Bacteroidales bacterium]|nr:LytTR family DNA-binding domain-containing protein [Bacteroidales bacterium]
MNKLRVLLVDDESDALDLLESLLLETQKVDIIEKISNPLNVECSIAKNKPDAIFLDIKMPDYNGLKLLENIRKYKENLPVIYVTAHNNYGVEAVKLKAFDYLVKPVNRKELKETIDNLYTQTKIKLRTDNCKIKLPINDGYIYVRQQDIFYLKADGNYTEINLISGEKYISSYNMGRLSKRLNGTGFERINRNLIANTEYLQKINRKNKTCLLKTGSSEIELPVSATFLQNMNKLQH